MILVINSGSSSIKFGLYDSQASLSLIYNGELSAIDGASQLTIVDADAIQIIDHALEIACHHQALIVIFQEIDNLVTDKAIQAVGHRVVHGGNDYVKATMINDAIIADLEQLVPLAELHQPHNLEAIKMIATKWPDLPQIACFDTAFHHTMPQLEQQIAIDRAVLGEEIKRYGFHGLSYQSIADKLPHYLGEEAAEGRVIVAHLGGGASLCAMKGRHSIATTMSFTPLDGLVMATRCGSLDPGVILYLLQQKKMTVEQVATSLNQHAGLKALSGLSGDMQILLNSKTDEASAAIDYFVYQLCRHIGAMTASLGGIDALVFTGGIGEHAAEIRQRVCEKSEWLGLKLNTTLNQQAQAQINAAESEVSIWIIETEEDQLIASQSYQLLQTREVNMQGVSS